MTEPQRRLAAIMFSDIVGYSKMMGDDEQATLELLREHNAIQLPIIAAHGGAVLKFIGDAILSSYPSVINAVHCGLAIRRALTARNKDRQGQPILVRIGVHIGDVIEQGGDIFGDGVNIAARIQPLAEPGGLCVSKAVHDLVRSQADVRMESLGARSLKNIKDKVEIFRVVDGDGKTAKGFRLRKAAALTGVLALAAMGAWTMRGKWTGGLAAPAAAKKDKRFAVFVAPFHGGDPDSVKDGQVMKTLIEERLTEQLGPLDDIRLVDEDASAPRSKDEAQALGAKFAANLVIWGEVVSLRGETDIQPFLTMIGTSFREQESSPLQTGDAGGNQLDLRKAKAAQVANLAVISAAWYYGTVDAERGLELIRTIAPVSAQSLVAEGYIRYDQKKWDEAEALFRKALTLDPQSTTAYNGLGNVFRVHDKNREAEAFYRKAIALRPDWPNAYFNLAQTYDMEGRRGQAMDEYLRVVKLAPDDAIAHRSLANLYDELGQYAQSAAEYRVSIENCKPDPNTAYGELFYYLALMRSGQQTRAAAFASDLVKKSGLRAPNLWPYHIAWMYAGRYAEEDVLKAADDAPADQLAGRHCEAYYFLGMRHLLRAPREGAGELNEARGYFEKCLKTKVYWFIEYRRAQAELAGLAKR